ncbi:MAG: O-antigen ligase family protein [candidate division NC10 bacterium]|nr:O-antigen ligase family protein [candidate division NC10 bacterium]
MSTEKYQSALGPVPLVAFVLVLAAGGGLLVTQTSAGLSLGATLLASVIFAAFLNAELGLHIILLSMLLSPEIVVGGMGGVSIGKPDTKGDLLVLRIEDLILSAVTLAWIARTAIFKELGLIRRTALNPAIFTYIASLLVATLFGIFFGNVRPLRGFFFLLKYIEYFVVYFIAVNHIRDERQLLRLITTAFVTCAVVSLIGIGQIPSGERVSAPFEGKYGEPNTLGGYLVFMLALILGLTLTVNSLPARIGGFTFAGLTGIPLLFTLSRSSWLAALPMLFTLILLSRRRFLLIVPLALGVAFGPILLPDAVLKRYRYTLQEKFDRGEYRLGGARFDTSTSARFESFEFGLVAWTQRPFLGYGVTGFTFMDAQYVRVLVESGLVGFCAFLWLVWSIFRTARNTYKRVSGTPYEGLALGYPAGLVALLVHAIGANTFIIVRIMEPFWFLTGIVVILPSLVESPGEAASTTTTPSRGYLESRRPTPPSQPRSDMRGSP